MSIQNRPLGEIADFIRGITFKPTDVVDLGTPGTIACMRTKNVQEVLDLNDVWAVSRSFIKRDEQIMIEGDILISSANSWNLVGKCSWIPKLQYPASFGGFVTVLRANPKIVLPRYLYHWFSSSNIQTIVRSFGQKTTNISNLNIDRCSKLMVPLPPIDEQKRIADILDKADALRAKRREAINLINSLTQSIFLEMFGDPIKNEKKYPFVKLGTVAKIRGGYAFKSTDYVENGIPLIRIGEVNRGIEPENICYLPSEMEKTLSRFIVRPGAILMSLTGTVGKDDYANAKELTAEFDKYFLNQRVAEITTSSAKLHKAYLLEFLKNEKIKKSLTDQNRGVRQANISNSDIENLNIPLPSIDLQIEFSNRVMDCSKIKNLYETQLNLVEQLFVSTQHQAFAGEL